MPSSLRLLLPLSAALLLSVTGCEETPARNEAATLQLDASRIKRRGSIDFVAGWELGRRVAAERGAPRLVFFTAEWCTYCRRMEETTFNDRAVAELATKFVCVLVDADREPEICRRLQVTGYPSLEIYSPGGASLGRLSGWQSAQGLIGSLQAALRRYALLEGENAILR